MKRTWELEEKKNKKNESKNRSRRAQSAERKKSEKVGKKKEAEAYVWTRVGASIADRLER
jgi:hypothetical protein